MKKIVLLSTLAMLAISGVQAQLKPDIERSKMKRTTEQKTIPPPAPPPVAKTSIQDVPVYSLTSVRVKIRTGNDNKEFPSKVHATLMAKSTPQNWRNYIQINLSNEMKINAETEFGLGLEGPPIPLQTFQSAGLKLAIAYEPNFFADAWKIEGISLVLEFKDQNGNLHPSLGNKTIVFSNAYGFLNDEYRYIDCFTDGSFAPITSVIRK
jgi:hypothetical protein